MKKKLVISLSVLLGLIAIALTLCFTVFTIKDVELDFRTSTELEWKNEEVIESGEINKGKCLLFLSKKGYVSNLEKKNPYLEVINIETVFPSKLIIHCAERKELFAIKSGDKTVYCDKDLKILRIENEDFTSTKENAILLEGLTITSELEVGSFLEYNEKGLERFFSSMVENSKTYAQTIGFCREIKISRDFNALSNKDETNVIISTFSDREIKILNIESNFSKKLQRMFQALPEIYELLLTNGDYTEAEVDRCSLLIGNQITNEDELYIHIYLDGEVIESVKKNKN